MDQNQPNEDSKLLTPNECADRLGISRSTLYRKQKKYNIPMIDLGHQTKRFHYPTVLKYLKERKPTE